MHRLPIVGVMGSGTMVTAAEPARELGQWLATRDVHLLTGGGQGIMAAMCRGFCEAPHRKGVVIGIVPCQSNDPLCQPRAGYPNRWVEIPIFTHLPLSGDQGTDPLSRNHINILSSRVIVAFPGGAGTASEMRLALQYDRPVIAYTEALLSNDSIPSTIPRALSLKDIQDFVDAHLP